MSAFRAKTLCLAALREGRKAARCASGGDIWANVKGLGDGGADCPFAGVNVSGAGKLPMADFRALRAGLGLGGVRTDIQSGNAVFDSDLAIELLEVMIRDAVAARFGFAPETFVLTAKDLARALGAQPFAGADGGRVHVVFLRAMPEGDQAALRALAQPGG